MEAAPATMEGAPTMEPSSNAPPPRLMISHMELNNFKSYYGSKMIGPFHKVSALCDGCVCGCFISFLLFPAN
jgi:hypothetical protein